MKSQFLTIFILMFFYLSGCQKDYELSMPKNITASQGTYINIIIVEWEPDIDAPGYLVWKRTPNGKWSMNEAFSDWTQEEPRFVDSDVSVFISGDVVSFKHYYMVFACEDIEVKSECAKTDGYSANIEKAVVTGITRSTDMRTITVTWEDQNPEFLNEISRSYQIYIKEENEVIRTEYNYSGTNFSFQVPNRVVDVKYEVSVNIKFIYDDYWVGYENCQLDGDYVLEN